MRKNVDLFLGSILVLYYVVINLVSSRKIAFSSIILLIGIVLIIFHFVKDKVSKNPIFIKCYSLFKVLISIALIFFIVIEGVIISFPKKSMESSDYILVLGAGVNRDGSLSQTLKDRLNATIISFKDAKEDCFIVVSGGKGMDEPLSEAEAMKKYLVKEGIEEEKILMEDKSTNTGENFKFSKKVIEDKAGKDIKELKGKIITTDFHAYRASILAKKNDYGEMVVYTSNSLWYLVPNFYTREALALIKSILFD